MSNGELPRRRPVRALPEETVRRIAAGEVVTRPAAAVKELIENSLDAGASHVRLEVKAGGKDMIRVTDNGSGMDRSDVRLAVARYATSKLSTAEDLEGVTTFGFRGEALASVAAVSRFTLTTNCDEEGPGTRLEVEGGDIREIAEAAHPRGTTVTARRLFYNLPARRGFLKSDGYELRLVAETFRGYAVTYPAVGFELVSNDKPVHLLAPADGRRERLRQLYDKKMVESFLDLRVDNPLLSVRGFLAEPSQARHFFDVQAIYFNNRPVRSRSVLRAVYDGYGPVIGNNRPNFILYLDTEPARLDVNVHPTKQEVRFADERFLFDFVSEAVRKTLGTARAAAVGSDDFVLQQSVVTGDEETAQGFWQLHNGYIFAQVTSGYVIVDQHAAHERILYEEALREQRNVRQQGLLFPITVELTAEQLEAYRELVDAIGRMGIQSKEFSGRSVVVETIPAGSYMGKAEIREFLSELAEARSDKAGIRVGLAKLVACKGAIKFGQRLSQPEMESLFNRLFACAEPYYCPHGRPAIIRITTDELGRKFGRT